MQNFKSPVHGQTITVERRIGGVLTGDVGDLSSNSITISGRTYLDTQLVSESCDQIFASVYASKKARLKILQERAEYALRKDSELKQQAKADSEARAGDEKKRTAEEQRDREKKEALQKLAVAKKQLIEARKKIAIEHKIEVGKVISRPWRDGVKPGFTDYQRKCSFTLDGENFRFYFSVEIPCPPNETYEDLVKRRAREKEASERNPVFFMFEHESVGDVRFMLEKFREWDAQAVSNHVQPFSKTINRIGYTDYEFRWDGDQSDINFKIGRKEAEIMLDLLKDYDGLLDQLDKKLDVAAKQQNLFK